MKKQIRELLNKQLGIMESTSKILNDTRREYDACRNRISSSINILLNTDWGFQSESMKRGEIMSYLKSAETILNRCVAILINAEMPYHNELYWLRNSLNKTEKKIEKKKKKSKKK